MTSKIRIGLIGYGKAGKAVANVLATDPRFELCWISRRDTHEYQTHAETNIPIIGIAQRTFEELFTHFPIEAIIDFSAPESVHSYGEILRKHGTTLVTAISNYSENDLEYIRDLGNNCRVICSPNITLGINFLMMAANLLRKIAPFADVEILEQHFRESRSFWNRAQNCRIIGCR